MSEIVTCIDFGNTFTKVGFRRSADDASDLFEDAENRRSGGDEDYCFPTFQTGTGAGTKYRENWKPLLFADAPGGVAMTRGMDALLMSRDLVDLATEYGVAAEALGHLRQIVSSARGLFCQKPHSPTATAPQPSPADDLIEHAVNFFSELRDKLRPRAASKFPGKDFDTFPTRLCLPAFGEGREGIPAGVEALFCGILQRAGWRIDSDAFLISEPVANIVGVLTQGSNQTWQPYAGRGDSRRFLHMGRMFDFASLVKAVQRSRPTYTVLTCDIGSYTTDVAVVRFHTTDDPDRRPDIWASSMSLGVSQLDKSVYPSLPEEKSTWLAECQPRERLQWRKRLYGELAPYYAPALDDEIGAGSEMGRIRAAVEGFAGQVTRTVSQLLERIGVNDCQDVILTGGGCQIEKLRNGVLAGVARHFGAGYLVHGPEGTPMRSSKTILSPRLVRGATALGGTSVYFDTQFKIGTR
jgi:hypothetical protein